MNKLFEKLNTLFSTLIVFQSNVKNFHWHIKGSDFFIFHKYTDDLSAKSLDFVDEVAEKLIMFNQSVETEYANILKASLIKQFPKKFITSRLATQAIVEQMQTVLGICKEIQGLENESIFVVAPLIDEIVLFFHKFLWQFKSSIE
ncbi:Dps family protein [Mesomycoplasma hyorhinis]|uniref:Dps family protein n=1 Tax=Mesomycoplasma hyorhinis TaxID=2100 RepID=UPI001C047031|nr:DNA starvation/stationary phase protection protein [Mesomycoplasma hyorhinis]